MVPGAKLPDRPQTDGSSHRTLAASERGSAVQPPGDEAGTTGLRVVVISGVRVHCDLIVNALYQRGCEHVRGTGLGPDTVDAVSEMQPHIILFDHSTASTLVRLPELRASAPAAKLIVFGVSEEHDTILAYAKLGAAGYVTSDSSPAELVATLERVHGGEMVCSPRIMAMLLREIRLLEVGQATRDPMDGLTHREREILVLIEQGHSNKQIAGALGIEIATVKNHVHHILDKLKVSRRGEAAARLHRADANAP